MHWTRNLSFIFIITFYSLSYGAIDFCEDMFGGMCLNEKGLAKKEFDLEPLKRQQLKVLQEALNKTAQSKGFDDFFDFYKKNMHQKNFFVSGGITQADFWKFFQEGYLSESKYRDLPENNGYVFMGDQLKQYFTSQVKCSGDKYTEDLKVAFSSDASKSRVFLISKEVKSSSTKVFKAMRLLFIEDPFSLINKVKSTCRGITVLEENEKYDTYQKLCSPLSLYEIEKENSELYRLGFSEERRQDFVDKWYPLVFPFIQPAYSSRLVEFDFFSNLDKDLMRIANKIQLKIDDYSGQCLSYKELYQKSFHQLHKELMVSMIASKKTINEVITRTYSQKRREDIESFLSDIRPLAGEFFLKLVDQYKKLSRKTKKTLFSEIQKIPLKWISPVDEDNYKEDDLGNLRLNYNKLQQDPEYSFFDKAYNHLSRGRYSFFLTLNAHYMWDSSSGKHEEPEHILLYPLTLLIFEKNKIFTLPTLGHEFFHKIDYYKDKIMGYNFQPLYQSLCQCLGESNSIRMCVGQEGEAFADWASAHLAALYIQSLPKEEQYKTALNFYQGRCFPSISSYKSNNQSLSKKKDFIESHPFYLFRMNGLFGTQPELRQFLGCSKPAPKYKYCPLN